MGPEIKTQLETLGYVFAAHEKPQYHKYAQLKEFSSKKSSQVSNKYLFSS